MDLDALSSSSSNRTCVSTAASNNNTNQFNGRQRVRTMPRRNNKRIASPLLVPVYSPSFVGTFINFTTAAASSPGSITKPMKRKRESPHRKGINHEIQYVHGSIYHQINARSTATGMEIDSSIQPFVGIHLEAVQSHDEYVPQFIHEIKSVYNSKQLQQHNNDNHVHEGYVPVKLPHPTGGFAHGNDMNVRWCAWTVHFCELYGCCYYYNAVT
ncbi:hypothetical protein KI387_039011, partial [Taxus chinensis]